MQFFLNIILSLFAIFVSINAQPAFSNQPEFFIKSTETYSETKLPRRSNYGNDLFVRDEGQEYLIQNEDLSYWSYYKNIIHNVDLDNDGINEAIVEASDGGGHGIIKYFIISKRDEKFYSVYSNKDFEGSDLKLSNGNILSVRKYDKGIDVTSQVEEISLFEFRNGELKNLSTSKNEAFIPAFNEINSFNLDDNNITKFITGNYDEDAKLDKLICNYWGRWGAVLCEVHSSVYGIIKINRGCKRIGILKSNTQGVVDLVCNRFSKIKFNGNSYKAISDD